MGPQGDTRAPFCTHIGSEVHVGVSVLMLQDAVFFNLQDGSTNTRCAVVFCQLRKWPPARITASVPSSSYITLWFGNIDINGRNSRWLHRDRGLIWLWKMFTKWVHCEMLSANLLDCKHNNYGLAYFWLYFFLWGNIFIIWMRCIPIARLFWVVLHTCKLVLFFPVQLFAVVAYFVRSWRVLLFVTTAPLTCYLSINWYVLKVITLILSSLSSTSSNVDERVHHTCTHW